MVEENFPKLLFLSKTVECGLCTKLKPILFGLGGPIYKLKKFVGNLFAVEKAGPEALRSSRP